MTQRANIGKFGEDTACLHLMGLGHSIVARNWRTAHCEVDIVSLKGSELHFVEVKAKTAPVCADPVLSVTATKQRNIISAAKAFMRSPLRRTLPADLEVMFDVLTVVQDSSNQIINYYPNAYRAIYV